MQSKSLWFRIKYKDLLNAIFLPGGFSQGWQANILQTTPRPLACGSTIQPHKSLWLSSPQAALGYSLLQRGVRLIDLRVLHLEKQVSLFFFLSPPRSLPREKLQALEMDAFVRCLSNPCSQLGIWSCFCFFCPSSVFFPLSLTWCVMTQRGSVTHHTQTTTSFQCSWIIAYQCC